MMRRYIGVMCCAIFVGWIVVPAGAQAPHKTVKECDAEWKAEKANLGKSRFLAAASPAEVDQQLAAQSEHLGPPGRNPIFGYGLIKASSTCHPSSASAL